MSKRQSLIILGVILIILPFLGLPTSWKSIATVAIGALIVLISLRIRPPQRPAGPADAMPYVEHRTEPPAAAPAPAAAGSGSPEITSNDHPLMP